jgi:hypothetical protein
LFAVRLLFMLAVLSFLTRENGLIVLLMVNTSDGA